MSEQKSLNPEAWQARWQDEDTPWDLGGVTPALVDWAEGRDLKGLRVLVPGCGRGYDAHFLAKRGAQVMAVDYAAAALVAAQTLHPHSRVDWRQADITAFRDDLGFDLVWEYTCFCALSPGLREVYMETVAEVLVPEGRFIGLSFSSVPNPENGPPFQIEPERFRKLGDPFFDWELFEESTPRSVKPRRGSEFWFEAKKRL